MLRWRHFSLVVLTLLWEWARNVFAIPQLANELNRPSEQNDNNREENPNAVVQMRLVIRTMSGGTFYRRTGDETVKSPGNTW
jgi:hypothetical protein